MTNYRSISLRIDYLKMIDGFVLGDPRYNSRADFVREAINEKMERLQELKQIKK